MRELPYFPCVPESRRARIPEAGAIPLPPLLSFAYQAYIYAATVERSSGEVGAVSSRENGVVEKPTVDGRLGDSA